MQIFNTIKAVCFLISRINEQLECMRMTSKPGPNDQEKHFQMHAPGSRVNAKCLKIDND